MTDWTETDASKANTIDSTKDALEAMRACLDAMARRNALARVLSLPIMLSLLAQRFKAAGWASPSDVEAMRARVEKANAIMVSDLVRYLWEQVRAGRTIPNYILRHADDPELEHFRRGDEP